MAHAMASLSKTRSGLWTSRKVIPADVRAAYGKSEDKPTWPAALTKTEAKAACASWLADVEARIATLRAVSSGIARSLTRREIAALAGVWYREVVGRYEDDPGDPRGWQASLEEMEPDEDKGSGGGHPDDRVEWVTQAHIAADLDRLLTSQRLRVTDPSRAALLHEMHELYREVCHLMIRRGSGDYGPDAVAALLPPLLTAPPKRPAVPVLAMFDEYVAERQPAAATVKAYRRQLQSLVLFLGHDDASRITKENLVAWKDALLAPQPDGTRRAARTVNDTYLAAARTVLSYGYRNARLGSNPATGVEALVPKKARLRDPGFTDAEAATILSATLQPRGQITREHALARRWVPWLCAYSGARVGEMAQLRGEDVFQDRGVWVLRITPEAGSTKDNTARVVPVHSHLIEQGFLEVAQAAKGPIFFDPARARGGGAGNPQAKKIGERLAAWVRKLGVTDPSVQPNHGWRHRFKTVARTAGLDPEARDRIPGHAMRTVGESYGVWEPKALSAEIEKLPRFEIAGV